jgi:hypothetical protein
MDTKEKSLGSVPKQDTWSGKNIGEMPIMMQTSDNKNLGGER